MNNYEIGIFFSRKYIFDPLNIANKISEKIDELGKVTILPVNESKNGPVIIYEENEHVKLFVTLNNIILHIDEPFIVRTKEFLKAILDVFKKCDISFTRIGLVNTKILGEKEHALFANNAFDKAEIIESREFQLSYFQNIMYEDIKLNCWKRYLTNNDKFIVTFDINTLPDDNNEINLSFAMNFIEFATDYMDNNQLVKLY